MRSSYVSQNSNLLCNSDAWFIFRDAGDGERESSEEIINYVKYHTNYHDNDLLKGGHFFCIFFNSGYN